ncbi:unnamed protein product [Cuscuta epithymum]|uniref:Uncharacterized protein n=1 Tax=Cuscuta epithymum TaxID=186058 RepID=A0AAV0FF80_9ASTE|nr:unnamed protein product [Cuscuta epithymum]
MDAGAGSAASMADDDSDLALLEPDLLSLMDDGCGLGSPVLDLRLWWMTAAIWGRRCRIRHLGAAGGGATRVPLCLGGGMAMLLANRSWGRIGGGVGEQGRGTGVGEQGRGTGGG